MSSGRSTMANVNSVWQHQKHAQSECCLEGSEQSVSAYARIIGTLHALVVEAVIAVETHSTQEAIRSYILRR